MVDAGDFRGLRFLRNHLGKDFVVGPLEGLWWADDIKTDPGVFRDEAVRAAAAAAAGRRGHADFLAAFGCELAVGRAGELEPTAFHMTSGDDVFWSQPRACFPLGLADGPDPARAILMVRLDAGSVHRTNDRPHARKRPRLCGRLLRRWRARRSHRHSTRRTGGWPMRV